jgi:hypothetical protein
MTYFRLSTLEIVLGISVVLNVIILFGTAQFWAKRCREFMDRKDHKGTKVTKQNPDLKPSDNRLRQNPDEKSADNGKIRVNQYSSPKRTNSFTNTSMYSYSHNSILEESPSDEVTPGSMTFTRPHGVKQSNTPNVRGILKKY